VAALVNPLFPDLVVVDWTVEFLYCFDGGEWCLEVNDDGFAQGYCIAYFKYCARVRFGAAKGVSVGDESVGFVNEFRVTLINTLCGCFDLVDWVQRLKAVSAA